MDTTVVIDYGSKTFKAGLSYDFPSDEAPRIVTPNAVEVASTSASAADGVPPTSAVHFPVQHGRIANLDEFEALLHHILYGQIGWAYGEEGNIVIAEPLLTPKADREALTQLLFEVFNVNSYFAQDSATLALFAVGRLNGCVVDVGHGKADVATVSDGQLNASSVRRLPFAGEDLTRLLERRLAQRGAAPRTTHGVESLKEFCALCADSPDEYDLVLAAAAAAAVADGSANGGSNSGAGPVDDASAASETFRLPDGQEVTVTRAERYEAAEALLRPRLFGHDCAGMADAALECISTQADGGPKKALYETVWLCGGGAAIPGLSGRLLRAITMMAPASVTPALCPVPEYMTPGHTARFAPWIGGVVLAKTLLQQNHLVTKGDYEEAGPLACHRKCA